MPGRPAGHRLLLITVGVIAVAAAVGVPLALRLTAPAAEPLPLSTVATVPLPGGADRFDYADVDPAADRLFAAHVDDGVLLAIDTTTNRVVATVPDLPSVTRVIVVPALQRVFASVAGVGQVAVIDPQTRTVIARAPVPGGEDDHGLLLTGGRAFVACDGNNKLITLTLPGLTELGRLDVGDRPDVLAADPARWLLYVAAESGDLTTVDTHPAAGRVTGRAHLPDNAHVVAVDPGTGRAYFPVPDTGGGHPGLLITPPHRAAR